MTLSLQQRILFAIFLLLITISIGVSGYHIFAPGSSFLDALYMTVITLTTIGYGEIIDLSHNPQGRIFTMILIMFGMGNIMYVASTITSVITDGELKEILRRRKMQRMINKLKNHIILCGGGVMIKKIIDELYSTKNDFVIISSDMNEINQLTHQYRDLMYIYGDAYHNDNLLAAGIETASGIITTLDDKDNLFVIVSAKKLNPGIRIVSSANDPEAIDKLKTVGVNSIISPNLIGGLRMVSEMIRPSVTTFLDIMMRDTSSNTRFSEVTVRKGSDLIKHTIGSSKIRDFTGLLILSLKKPNSDSFVYNPFPDEELPEGTVMIVIGSTENVGKLKKLANDL
ncbi:MAG: NAD-binding protein [Candidatus Margulisbacteria bacterium]|nr:NAD-binding protein [Candidatus Margulisiibacteriota bacterium]